MSQNGMFFRIELGIFPLPIFVSIGQTPAQFITALVDTAGYKDVNHEELIDTLMQNNLAIAQTMHLENGDTVIWIYDMPQSLMDLSTLQHEIAHAVQFVLERTGIPICSQTTEVLAYGISYVTEEIYSKFNNITIVKKKDKKVKTSSKPLPKQAPTTKTADKKEKSTKKKN